MKYDVDNLIKLSESELRDEYKKKSLFRKIKINKQPNILDKSYAMKIFPYSQFTKEELEIKCAMLEEEYFLNNLRNFCALIASFS